MCQTAENAFSINMMKPTAFAKPSNAEYAIPVMMPSRAKSTLTNAKLKQLSPGHKQLPCYVHPPE